MGHFWHLWVEQELSAEDIWDGISFPKTMSSQVHWLLVTHSAPSQPALCSRKVATLSDPPQQVHVKYHTLLWTALLSHGDVERALWETSQAHSEQLHQDYEADTRNRRTCHDLVQGKCYSWRITLILNSFWSQNHHSHWVTIYTSTSFQHMVLPRH